MIEWLEERCLLASLTPTATTQAATVTSMGATLNGSVNPNGSSTDTYFLYSTDSTLSANVVATLAGMAGQTGYVGGSAARFNGPVGVAWDPTTGNIYVADAGNDTIRMITPAGVVTTLAGSPGQAGSADGTTGSAARFDSPEGVAVDSKGNIYVADTGNDTIRMITPAGVVTTLAGTPGQAGSIDGAGSAARFNSPEGVAVDSVGNIYVADTGNDTIRMMMPGRPYTTMTWGTAGKPGSADGPGIDALFNRPEGVAVDSAGNVYVADTGNDTIRMITASAMMVGETTTLAGSPDQVGSVDGTGSAARFDSPEGVVVDSAGNVYVADTGNDTIRMIMSGSMVMTLAGTAGQAGSADGTGSAALFNDPRGVAVDGADNVYVADTGNDTIRKLSTPSVPAQSGLTGTSAVPVNVALTGLQPNTTYYYEVVATNSVGTTDGSILSFTTPAAPAATLATTQAASNVTSTAATLSGSVNPEGAATSVSFIYGTDPTLTTGTTTTTAQPIGNGTSAVGVNVALTGLHPNTTYYFKVEATNSAGTTDGSILSFTTPAAAAAPLATTQAASNVTATTAALNGSVNPEGGATSVSFVYGTDRTLTTGTTTTTAQQIASGTSAVLVNAALTGLQPNTTYYFKVVATNSVGTTVGSISNFTTAAAPQPPPPAEIQRATVVFRQATNRKGKPVGKPTLAGFQFTFNTVMNGATAGNRANYMLGTYVQVIKRVGRKMVRVLQLKPVSFTVIFQSSNSAQQPSNSVTLLLTGKQTFPRGGQITLSGTGISSAAGGLLDGGVNAVYNISANARSITRA